MISTESHSTWYQKLLIVMMTANVLVLLLLAWQIHDSEQKQQVSIQSILNDYAGMAGQQYIRNIKSQIGYSTLYDLNQQLLSTDDPTVQIESYLNQADSQLSPSQVRVRNGIASITLINRNTNEAVAIKHALLDKQNSKPSTPQNMDVTGFRALHHESANNLSFEALLAINDNHVVLIKYRHEFVLAALNFIYQNRKLLPSNLIDDQQGNQALSLRLETPAKRLIWQSPVKQDTSQNETMAQVQITIDDEYGGLFANHKLTTNITKSLAQQLIKGGLPTANHLPLYLLLLISLFVMGFTFWLYRRNLWLARQKELFIARASHELKTPLTQIRLFAETLSLNRTKHPSDQAKYINIIHQESIRLSQLVDNILNQHQINQGHSVVFKENFALKPFIRELIDQQSILWQHKTIKTEFQISSKLEICTDANLLKQILINLLDNAVKFGPEQQTIQIQAGKVDDGHIVIKITDQGPGIPSRQLKTVLNNYQRLPRDEQRGINGNGLGLSIAAYLVKLLEGQLKFEHPAKGLSVMIELPNYHSNGTEDDNHNNH